MNPQAEIALVALGWSIATAFGLVGVAWLREKLRADIGDAVAKLDGRYVLREVCDERHERRQHREAHGDVAG